MSLTNVKASKNYTYYSKKVWTSYQNLIDVYSDNIELGFTNSQNIYTQVIALENENYLTRKNSDILTGNDSLKVVETESFNQIYLGLKFSERIKIGNIKLNLTSQDKNGQSILKTIYSGEVYYKNGKLNLSKAKKLMTTYKNGEIILNLANVECDQLSIVFDNKIGNTYQLSYFQVMDYQKLEHSYWTSDYIENTDTKTIAINEGTGNYLPDGTSNTFYQGFATTFSPNVKAIMDYSPKYAKSYFVAYDLKVDGINPKTPVDVLSPLLDNRISGWEGSGNVFFSLTKDSKYLMTNDRAGHRYLAYKTHWNYDSNDSFASSNSCYYLTNSYKKPCYEHEGHVYGSGNVYDIMKFEYVNLFYKDEIIIDKVDYFLCDIDREKCNKIGQGKDEVKKIELHDSGRFKIKSVIYDAMGNHKDIFSRIFLIDNIPPVINYNYTLNKRNLAFKINVNDNLSKVEKIRYQVSSDKGQSYGEYSEYLYTDELELNFNQSGDYCINVEATDYAGNISTSKSQVKTLDLAELDIAYAYGHVYDLEKDSYLFFQLTTDSKYKEDYLVELLKDGKSIYLEKGIFESKKLFKIKYPANKVKTNLEIIVSNGNDKSKVSITTYEKSRKHFETSLKTINYKEKVVSLVNKKGKQEDYYEYLTYQILQENKKVKAGQGIELKVVPTINNTCYEVLSGTCVFNSEIIGEIKMNFSEGELTKNRNTKLVNNEFVLDNVWLDENSGLVTDYGKGLAGGRKWYTSLNSKNGNYDYEIIGEKLGVNECSFKYLGNYQIEGDIYQGFISRFVDINNPFPNNKSRLWKSEEIFKNLKGKLVKIFNIEAK